MSNKKEIKLTPAEASDYPLIPMSQITDEARKIAVLWAEGNGYDWIGDKHKLASDIMNYARRYAQAENARLIGLLEKEVRKNTYHAWGSTDDKVEQNEDEAWQQLHDPKWLINTRTKIKIEKYGK
jgi:hypothetical protein